MSQLFAVLQSCCGFAGDTLMRLKSPRWEGVEASASALVFLISSLTNGASQLCRLTLGLPRLWLHRGFQCKNRAASPSPSQCAAFLVLCVQMVLPPDLPLEAARALRGLWEVPHRTRQGKCGCGWRIHVPFCRGLQSGFPLTWCAWS